MRKLKIAYILAFAPALMAADYGTSISDLTVNMLPKCGADEYLAYDSTASGLICTKLSGGSLNLPNCSAMNQLLTYTMTGEVGVFQCTAKGSEALSASDVTTINTTYQQLINMETQIRNLETGVRASAAKFCGVTAGTTNGAITSGATKGLAAAATLCQQVAACGAGARMCSVYDMYQSVATGAVTAAQNIPKAWVYQASWQFSAQAGQADPLAGLSDNCGSFTYPTGDRKWYGTAVVWNKDTAGDQTLQFFAGPNGAACSATLPIACCK